ncbi:hypothetical protein OIU76_030623, partial [Salix suchowensis]
MMKLHWHHHCCIVEVPEFQLHHSSGALLLGSGSDSSMPGCRLSVLPLQSTDSPVLGQLFAATFSCHSILDEPNPPSSAPCWVWSCQLTSFLSVVPEELLRNCIRHFLQSGG